ncbi:MAG: molybdopterin-dependent oxidoreductase [Candidatus Competibacteraceae bacterium]|nr:molybdopterin-dependent oxidoreductase [Candidatus Competibacteraceae bacterium]
MPHSIPTLITFILLTFGITAPVIAQEQLDRPTGEVILAITGAISRTNAPGKAEFDLAMLQALGVEQRRRTTPWTDGIQEFDGVLMRDVMKAVGATGQEVLASALNDYAITIPLDDFTQYPILLAFAANGKALTRRDKGPLWIIYPTEEFPETNTATHIARSIWQLYHLEVR